MRDMEVRCKGENKSTDPVGLRLAKEAGRTNDSETLELNSDVMGLGFLYPQVQFDKFSDGQLFPHELASSVLGILIFRVMRWCRAC